MSENEPVATVAVPTKSRPRVPVATIGVHLGLAMVCVSAIYTDWQRSMVTYPQWGVMLLTAGALLYVGLSRKPGVPQRGWARMTLALGGLLAFRLCYLPQLESIPRLAELLPAALLETYPSIALVGVIIALISWLLYARSDAGEQARPVPLLRSALLASALLLAIAAFNWLVVGRHHELMASEVLRPALIIVQGAGLLIVLLSMQGGPGIKRAPHIYIALSLVAAFIRNMAFPTQY